MRYKTKQPIICVHKQLINTLNMSNYVYLGILAKFHAGQLYSASLNSVYWRTVRLNGWLGFFLLKLYVIENKTFHIFFFFKGISFSCVLSENANHQNLRNIPSGKPPWCSWGVVIFMPHFPFFWPNSPPGWGHWWGTSREDRFSPGDRMAMAI